VGTHARNYPPAKGPAGATVDLRFTDRTRSTGELLAVETSALLLLQGNQLIRVPLAQIRSGSAPKVSFDRQLRGDTRERLRLISRYPQGVSSDLETQLLRAYGLTEIRTRP
jgi:hypothetical protein